MHWYLSGMQPLFSWPPLSSHGCGTSMVIVDRVVTAVMRPSIFFVSIIIISSAGCSSIARLIAIVITQVQAILLHHGYLVGSQAVIHATFLNIMLYLQYATKNGILLLASSWEHIFDDLNELLREC